MALTNRLDLYPVVTVDNNQERDYLNTSFTSLEFDSQRHFRVPQMLIGRLDLISYKFYQTVDLWWLIAQANDLLNINTDMYLGQILIIPELTTYYNFYNTNVRA